ncbi:MAG: type IV toxin-antitoxin system AbiEi family antitoxin domain-containing protein [Mycobacteriales bacterium]
MDAPRGRRSATAGVPPEFARVPFGVIRPADAASVYAHPRTQIARLVEHGLLHPLAPGYYALVPRALVGADFRPTLEAAAYGVAAASYGADEVLLMGLSAARLHGALPRALSVAVVAVPVQRRALRLTDRPATVTFVRRDTRRLDGQRMRTDLGSALVTGVAQTVLDLAHRPDLGGAHAEAQAAAVTLLGRCDPALLAELATQQRLETARRRILRWVEPSARRR